MVYLWYDFSMMKIYDTFLRNGTEVVNHHYSIIQKEWNWYDSLTGKYCINDRMKLNFFYSWIFDEVLYVHLNDMDTKGLLIFFDKDMLKINNTKIPKVMPRPVRVDIIIEIMKHYFGAIEVEDTKGTGYFIPHYDLDGFFKELTKRMSGKVTFDNTSEIMMDKKLKYKEIPCEKFYELGFDRGWHYGGVIKDGKHIKFICWPLDTNTSVQNKKLDMFEIKENEEMFFYEGKFEGTMKEFETFCGLLD